MATTLIRVPERLAARVRDQQSAPNPLESKVYTKIGKSAIFEVRPAVLHFGGYQVNQKHIQEVHIVNISGTTQRLDWLPTSTPFFKLKCNKKGLIAPGMSETIAVVFEPSEWRYYYDCLKIRAQDENLLVPIHGYPIMNEVIFPRLIDFGKCPLSQTAEKIVKLECKVPVQFEFEFTIVSGHDDFRIYPMKGIIPPNGHVDIVVQFRPSALVSADMKVEVNVSQFNFERFVCTFTGSGFPGIVRTAVIKELEEALTEEAGYLPPDHPFSLSVRHPMQGTLASMARSARGKMKPGFLESYTDAVALGPRGGGAGGGDAFTRSLSMDKAAIAREGQGHRKMERRATEESIYLGPVEQDDILVEGIKFPPKLDSVHAVNQVLNQVPGKLSGKDLRAALQYQKELKEEENAPADSGKKSIGGKSRGSRSSRSKKSSIFTEETRQMKEATFSKFVSEVQERKRAMDIKFFKFIGAPLLTEEEIDDILSQRRIFEEKTGLLYRNKDRHRTVTEYCDKERPKHEITHVLDHSPTYDVYLNNEYLARNNVIDRLKRVFMTVIFRKRAEKRIAKIKQFLEPGGGDREKVRHMVEMENKEAGSRMFVGTQVPITEMKIEPGSIYTEFLMTSEGAAAEIPKQNSHEVSRFIDLEPMPLKVPVHSEVMEYSTYPRTVQLANVPVELTRRMRTGAEEEEGVRKPRGHVPEIPEHPTEEILNDVELHPFEIFRYDSKVRSFFPPLAMSEVDPDYFLSAFQRSTDIFRTEEIYDPSGIKPTSGMAHLSQVFKAHSEYTSRPTGFGDWEVPLPKPLPGPQEDDRMNDVTEQELQEVPCKMTRDIPTIDSIRTEFYIPGIGPPEGEEVVEEVVDPKAKGGKGAPPPESNGKVTYDDKMLAMDAAVNVKDVEIRVCEQTVEEKNAELRQTHARIVTDKLTAINELISEPRFRISVV